MTDSPDKVLAENDPGDDVQRRYSYQAKQAAILALALLDDESGVEELFCEHHEDILVKHRTGKFVGYQVKTREDGSEPLKAGDEETIKSLRRFIGLDKQFATHFERFVLGSSCGFWQQKRNTSNFPYLLELAAESNGTVPTPLNSYLKRLCVKKGKTPKGSPATDATDPLADALAALRKVHVEPLSGLKDIDGALIRSLHLSAAIGDRQYSELAQVATGLYIAMLQAAALQHEAAWARYLAICLNPIEQEVEDTITGKRVTRATVLRIVAETIDTAPSLVANTQFPAIQVPQSLQRLTLKLSEGGLSLNNIDLAQDHRSSTETLLLQWMQRLGQAKAKRRYDHLYTLVRSHAQEVHDQVQDPSRRYGPEMMAVLRTRLRELHQADEPNLFGIRYEHLLGMAHIITSDCKLWWSDPFPIPSEATS